ncbi:hypothetical protein Tco_0078913 [Tanacetum coccineum]
MPGSGADCSFKDDDDDAKSGYDELKIQDDQDDDDEAQIESEDEVINSFIQSSQLMMMKQHMKRKLMKMTPSILQFIHPLMFHPQMMKTVTMMLKGLMLKEKSQMKMHKRVPSLIFAPTEAFSSNTDSSLHSITTTTNPDSSRDGTTQGSSLLNLPNFGSLFGFDNRLKALEDNFSKFKQTNQYAEALSSIPGIVDQIREESQLKSTILMDSIDEGMKKVIKEQVKSEVSKITPQIEKLVNEQLEFEVLMEANKSISRSDIQRQLYKALVDAYEADKILLDTYGDTVTTKSLETEQILSRTLPGTEPGPKEEGQKRTESTMLQEKKTTTSCRKDYYRSLKQVSMISTEEEVHLFLTVLNHLNDYLHLDRAWILNLLITNPSTLGYANWQEDKTLASQPRSTISTLSAKATTDVLFSRSMSIPFHHFINNDLEYLCGGESSLLSSKAWEDLQLGVESYQKKLNLTKPDTYRSNLRRRDAYTPYSDPRGFIYENKDKKNRLMHIDELHRLAMVDPYGFEGYLKMMVEVPDSS